MRVLAGRRGIPYPMEDGTFVSVDALLYHIDERPYFSVTGSHWQDAASCRRGHESKLLSSGCIHDVILAAAPLLGPVVALHLADDEGVPMHALANGRYWYDQDLLEGCARVLRMDVADIPLGLDQDAFEALVDAQRPRWKQEAAAAIAILGGAA